MKVLAVFNIKGGVGKTATAVNLSWLAAQQGRRVLLWDLDPQAAASFYFRVRPRVKGGARKLIRGKRQLDEIIRATDYEGLDLAPADFRYRHLDLDLDATKKPARRLARLLFPLSAEYDVAILDCAPSISLVSEAIFAAADALLVPTIPTSLSLRTLEQLEAHLEKRTAAVPVLPFFSMVDPRKALHRHIVSTPRPRGAPFLETRIPYSAIVERMGIERAPVGAFAPQTPAALAFGALWREVLDRLLWIG